MSRWKVICLVLIIGLGIGSIVPAATYLWSSKEKADSALNTLNPEKISGEVPERESYHFGFKNGVLSVIEGEPGENGNVILTGLSVESWPDEILDMAPKVEFYSLDEVQSFIDTASESLWLE